MFDIYMVDPESPVRKIWAGKEEELINKYQKQGIYCIKIENNIVYIGKSQDMLRRIFDHMNNILNKNLTKTHKYVIIREAIEKGYSVTFDVLADCSLTNLDELGEKEGELIRLYRPELNTQIPFKGDYKHWNTNSRAKYVTLKEIMVNYEGSHIGQTDMDKSRC